MAYDVGTAVLQVVPSFRDFEKSVRNAARKMGDDFRKELEDSIGKGLSDAIAKATKSASKDFGKGLSDSMTQGLAGAAEKAAKQAAPSVRKAEEHISRARIEAARSTERELAKLQEAAAKQRGAFAARFQQGREKAQVYREDPQLRDAIAAANARIDVARREILAREKLMAQGRAREVEAERRAILAAEKAAEDMYEAAVKEDFMRARKAREQMDALHEAGIKEDHLRELRARKALSDMYDAALHEDLVREVRRRNEMGKQYEAAIKDRWQQQQRAQKELADLHQAAINEDAKRTRQAREKQAADAERAFARTFSGRANAGAGAASASIQEITVTADTSPARQQISQIRTELQQLSDKRIGVNIDVDTFIDEVEQQFVRLREMTRDETMDIDVRVDAAGAATELGAILALAGRIDDSEADVTVDIDTLGARAKMLAFAQSLEVNLSRLQMMIALGATMGTAIVPAAAGAAMAIGAIGTAALAAASGIGVLALGFGGVGEAVQALGKAEDDAVKSQRSMVQSQNQVASALDGVKSARMALANTVANNADAAIKADQAVAKAARDVADERRKAVQDQIEAAARVASAQRNLARDEIGALRSREDLNQAYRDAQRAFEDLSSSMQRNSLDQRQALLDVQEAKVKLDSLVSNNRASEEEREQARITYERRKLQYADLQREQRQLAEDHDEYATKGVEGSDRVVDAQQRVIDSDQRVKDSRISLAKAQRDQQRQQIDSQRAIGDALQALANEERDRDAQRRQAAFATASAQQGLVSAQRSLQSAYASAGAAGQASLDQVNTAMGKISPTAQRFARYIHSLRDDFYALRGAAADGMLSGLQKAMQSMEPYLPTITAFVRTVSNKLGDIFVRLADSLKDPVFQRFFAYMSTTAVPTLDKLATIGINMTKGFLGLFLGFTPLSEDVTDGFVKMSESFANWSANLSKNKSFQAFLAYLRDNGPLLVKFFVSAAKAGGQLVEAMAPIGAVVFKILIAVFEFINKIPPDTLAVIIAGIAGLAGAIGLLGAVTSVMAISSTAAIVAGVAAVLAVAVTAWTIMFQRLAPLRNAFFAMWQQLKDIFARVWAAVQPVLADLAESALKLWHGAIVPAFHGIITVAQELWTMLRPVFDVIMLAIKLLAGVVFWLFKNVFAPAFKGIVWVIVNIFVPIVKWLWQNIVKPIFASIGLAIQIAAAIIKVAFGLIQIAIKVLASIFMWLWEKCIKPLWVNLLQPFFKDLGGIIDKYVKPHWDKAIKALAGFWDWLMEKARTPIKFIVETLLNKGILAGYNTLAEAFDVEPKNVQIPAPKGGWASGGVVDVLPGYSPGVDNYRFYSPGAGIAVDLSGGEGILRPELTRMVRPWLDEGNAVARKGGTAAVQRWLGGYARGGVIPGGKDSFWGMLKNKSSKVWDEVSETAKEALSGAKQFLSDPVGSFKTVSENLIKMIPGHDTTFVKGLIGLPRKMASQLADKFTSIFGGDGKPVNVGGGWPSSPGEQRGDSGVWRSVLAIIKSIGPPSGSFGNAYRPGDPRWHGSGRAVDWMGFNQDALAMFLASKNPLELIHRTKTRDYAYTRGVNKGSFNESLMNAHRNHIHVAFDQGGWLPDTRQMPGGTMSVFHGRRQPDAVLTNDQWALASKAMAAQVGNNSGRGDVYNFDFERSTLTPERLQTIQSRKDTIDRVNRPNW